MLTRPILRYHGGKWKLGKWIISHFPQHRIYCEAFGGGGSVLLQKSRSYSEIYNDKWDLVYNVFYVLRNADTAAELKRRILLTPYSRTEFNMTGDKYISEITDPIEKARLTLFRSFSGFGSASTNAKHATGFRADAKRPGSIPAHDWVNYANHIETFVNRLKGVVIENRDYKSISLECDSIETLHYWDPPYVHTTRNLKRGNAMYAYEMSDNDHIDMAQHASELKGMVIISGYNSDLYNDLFIDWVKFERATFGDGACNRTECLWLNKSAADKQHKLFI